MGRAWIVIYPKEHARLADEIAASGAIVSEFPLGTPPLAQNFPYRNRVLSGLCLGVLVIEAAEHSGSLITRDWLRSRDAKSSRLPGNITSQTSFGPNYLIKDGAKLVQHWRDVIEEFPREMKEKMAGVERTVQAGSNSPSQPAFEAVELSELSAPSSRCWRLMCPRTLTSY